MIYIAPPFGTYMRLERALSVLGSFTAEPRPGRASQTLRTVRRVRGAWINSIGLRNPGIRSLSYRPGVIYSLAGIAKGDWERMLRVMQDFAWPAYLLELNLSCPNVADHGPPPREVLEGFARLPNAVISVKLPPNLSQAEALTDRALEAGVRLIHLSNTLPSPLGGVSGWPLFNANLLVVAAVARAFPPAQIIAGGGINSLDIWQSYQQAGARHASLGTVWFNPARAYALYRKMLRHRR